MSTTVRSRSNRQAQAETTNFPIAGGEMVTLPLPPKGAAIRSLAEKLGKPFKIGGALVRLAPEVAGAVADITIDPAEVRQRIEADQFEHQDTPSGRRLVLLPTLAWTSGISSDGANGRSRLTLATGSTRDDGPWPLPESTSEPVLRYKAASIDRLARPVVASATAILPADMVTRLRRNPRGVWNPPTLVVGQFVLPDGKARFLLHAAEGSTRITGAQYLSGTKFDGPIRNSNDVRSFIRAERARIASDLVAMPENEDAWQAAKLATVPVRIVLAVLEPDGTLSTAMFPQVISEYIESVHVEPRGWDPGQQGNAIGERLVQVLQQHHALSATEAADILQRDHFHVPSATPDIIVARFVRAVTDRANYPILREVILDEPGKSRLSAPRRAAAVGPLLLRTFRDAPMRPSATAALLREHLPDELDAPTWSVTDRTTDQLLSDAEAALDTHSRQWSDASRELVARGVGPMAVLGLILSDQGQAVDNIAQLRGPVAKVIAGLAMTKGGLRTIADAIRTATRETPFYPVKRKPDGSERTLSSRGGGRVLVRYVPDQRETNIEVRALGLTDGHKPRSPQKKADTSADQQFADLQKEMMSAIGEAVKYSEGLRVLATGDGSTPMLKVNKLDPELLGPAPERLLDLRDFITNNLAPLPAGSDIPEPDVSDDSETEEQEVLVADLQ